ncbi:molybdopterin cofactor-binding domain-containing protein [Aestuariivirga sp.]|uniref:xanthine dehydrogenase family protein molybdopterin-binding subunit n=1 Tax=Aestuariivirga sp. TaxID=2650926 RepID=UPI00301A7140
MNEMSGFPLKPAPFVTTEEPAQPTADSFKLNRRSFLKASIAAGGGLMLDISLPRASLASKPGEDASFAAGKATLVIGADDSITLIVPGGEMGQGINSALAQIIAEELPLDFTRIRTVPAPYGAQYGTGLQASQVTGGSSGVRGYFDYMLDAGATARSMLVAAAIQKGGDPNTLRAVAGFTDPDSGTWTPNLVRDDAGNSWISGELATEAASTNPTTSRMSDPDAYKVIGTRKIRPDIREKVNGSAVFGLDVQLPGMKFAAVKHAPALGAKVSTMGAAPAGTLAVNLDTAVAVVAADSWAARKALNALTVTWTSLSYAQQSLVDTATQTGSLNSLLSSTTSAVAEAKPAGTSAATVVSAINSQPRKLNLTYSFPMLAHACMEVLNCTVEPLYAPDGVTVSAINVWCPTQAPDWVVNTVTALLPALPRDKISVTTTLMGGGLGRKIEQDYVAQAVRVALFAKAPVKLMWWREEDFARDFFRPAAVSKIQVGLDANGAIQGWYNRIAAPSVMRSHGFVSPTASYSSFVDSIAVGSAVGNGDEPMPYADAMTRRVVDYVEQKTGFSLGFWRSVGQSISCFAVESAIDECARLLGRDPYDYRLSLLAGNDTMKALLEDVAQLSSWKSAAPPGTARGMALSPGFGSSAAMVAEVTRVASGSTTNYKVSRIFCSVDCGFAVNPDQVVAQIQGGILQGMSSARWGRMQFDHGVAQVKNFSDYRLGRMADTPIITVRIVNQGSPLGGIGEVGVPPVAPAIANAYAALTGTRKRNLPLGI